MAAKAGEKAGKAGDFRCEKCHKTTHVKAGDKIPKCPHCGSDSFGTRENEPGNR